PYSIVTTATGVFSRANSFFSLPNRQKQHYIRRAEYRGHRCSCSLSSSEDMYLPSASASNANGEYAGGRSGNAPRALPVLPGVSANSIAAWNAAAGGSYSAYAASVKKSSHPLHPCPSPRLLPFPTTRVPTATTRPSVMSTPPPMHGPRISVVYEEPGETEDADGDADLDAQHAHKNDGTPSHRWRPVALPFAISSSSASASFSSSAVSSPFAPKHKHSPFASRYEYAYLATTNTNANNADDGQGRAITSPSPSPSPTGHFRNGRVKGMVRSFESSGSESGGGASGRAGGRVGSGMGM
ncbi:hypothetical protein K438DRAFT_1842845, partial [Mycena galopus ATCC 62051]